MGGMKDRQFSTADLGGEGISHGCFFLSAGLNLVLATHQTSGVCTKEELCELLLLQHSYAPGGQSLELEVQVRVGRDL